MLSRRWDHHRQCYFLRGTSLQSKQPASGSVTPESSEGAGGTAAAAGFSARHIRKKKRRLVDGSEARRCMMTWRHAAAPCLMPTVARGSRGEARASSLEQSASNEGAPATGAAVGFASIFLEGRKCVLRSIGRRDGFKVRSKPHGMARRDHGRLASVGGDKTQAAARSCAAFRQGCITAVACVACV